VKASLALKSRKPVTVRRPEAFVLVLAGLAVLAPCLGLAINHSNGTYAWSGAYGPVPDDAAQYLVWIRDASQHILVGNLFGLDPVSRNFLHPGVLASSLLARLGLSPPLAFLVAVVAGVVVLSLGARSYVRATVPEGWGRPIALAAGLLFVSPLLDIVPNVGSWVLIKMSSDSPTNVMSGYPYAAISIGMVFFALTLFIRLRPRHTTWSPTLCGILLIATWLQPWQGVCISATLLATEALLMTRRFRGLAGDGRRGLRRASLGMTGALACIPPLVYLSLLQRFDPAFKAMVAHTGILLGDQRWWMMVIVFAPLLVPAVAIFFVPVRSLADLVLRVLPTMTLSAAILINYTQIAQSPDHALRGFPIALAVPAVVALTHLMKDVSIPLRAVSLVGWMAIIGIVSLSQQVVTNFLDSVDPVRDGARATYMRRDDRAALDLLASAELPPGGVIATTDVARMVPWTTGRQAWYGNDAWTPNANARRQALDAIGFGAMSDNRLLLGMGSARFVAATGARYFLIGCKWSKVTNVQQLAVQAEWIRRVGCATLIKLRPASASDRANVDWVFGPNSLRSLNLLN